MSNADTPAHPADGGLYHLGLTKREIFAMAAMQGIVANEGWTNSHSQNVAMYAVRYADALIAELANTKRDHGEGVASATSES